MYKIDKKSKYNIDDLLHIISVLRAPDGCPWDAAQTHESIKKNFIEETYEVVEAINQKDSHMLCEELGDILMQVALHTQMAKEEQAFTFDDVTTGVCEKLIVRHPHVFSDGTADDVDAVLTNWDAIKRQTKGQKTVTSAMDSVPRELPALMRAQKIQHKASKVGFDWDSVDGALEKLSEEIAEFRQALANGTADEQAEEFGDILFSAVNVARFIDVDAEEALTGSTDKFLNRFRLVEKMANESGIDMASTSLEELDKLWDKAKTMV